MVIGSGPEASQTLTYSLPDADTARVFQIDPASARLTTKAEIDFEGSFVSRSPLYVTVRATDNGAGPLSTQSTIRVTVVDLNEAPVCASSASLSVSEDRAVGAVVGNALLLSPPAAIDFDAADAPNSLSFTYALTSVAASADFFTISNITGDITLGGMLDYEKRTNYSLNLRK